MAEVAKTLRITLASSPGSTLGLTAGTLYLAFIGLPVLTLLVRAFQQESFLATLSSDMALTALRLSLVTSTISISLLLLVGTPFAYLLARSTSPFVRLVETMIELPIILPPVVAGVAMLMAFGRQGIIGPALENIGVTLPFTTIAVVFAQMFVASPFYIRSARLGFQSVARDYEDVSQTLGVSPWWTFWRLTVPLAAPSLATGIALAWARALAEFGATLVAAALVVTFFMSGWDGPAAKYIGWLWFMIKIGIVVFLFIWVRATFPRLRIDQLMALAWKFLLPLSLTNLAVTTVEVYFFRNDLGVLSTNDLWVMSGINLAVTIISIGLFGSLIQEKVKPAKWPQTAQVNINASASEAS